MAASIQGTNAMIEQAQRRRFSPEYGWQTVRTWIGPRALATALEETLVIDPTVTDINTDHAEPSTVSAAFTNLDGGTSPYMDEQSALWELIPVELDQDLRTHPRLFPTFSGTVAPQIEEINAALRKGNAFAADIVWTDATANMYKKYAELRTYGIDSWLTYNWTIRKSWCRRKGVEVPALISGVTKVFTFEEIGVPTKAQWGTPKVHTWTGGAWGEVAVPYWMKKSPQVRFNVKPARWEMTEEWQGAMRISGTLYDGGDSSL